ncbi:MAG: hypothetical protein Q9160_001609 [Pyrenula sp. 1 TL-2023]
MSENIQKPPKAAALRGAVFAFSPSQEQELRQSLKPTVNSAKTAATLAAIHRSKTTLPPAAASPAKSKEIPGSSDTTVLSFRDSVQRHERSNSELRSSKPGILHRPDNLRSSSHIAARLAGTKPSSEANNVQRSASVPRSPPSPKLVSSFDKSGALHGHGMSVLRWPSVDVQSEVKAKKGALLSSPRPAAFLSPQSTGAANVAARTAASAMQNPGPRGSLTSHEARSSSLSRHPSTSPAHSGGDVRDSTEGHGGPPRPTKPDLLRQRSVSRSRKPSPSSLSKSSSPLRDLRTGLTTSNLADAMVASSLASSRAPSPTKASATPPPPPRRRRHSRAGSVTTSRARSSFPPFFQSGSEKPATYSASTSPKHRSPAHAAHSLRTTLRHRSTSSSSDEDPSQRGRRHLVRKHPHKYHEGSRQRWRPILTATERRRYEGVWAANRGLWTPTGHEQRVCNLVVKDLWERSGLGVVVLGDIWDLVSGNSDNLDEQWASRNDGRKGSEWPKSLGKKEFVVGLWLVDQSLKGRKLPARVVNDVWESTRGVEGVKIKGIG